MRYCNGITDRPFLAQFLGLRPARRAIIAFALASVPIYSRMKAPRSQSRKWLAAGESARPGFMIATKPPS